MKSSNEMIERLGEIISRKETHQDYKKVVEKADLYRKLLTGENMDSLMRKFDLRESDELFEQRKAITQHITKTVAQNVIDVYHKIPRSNSVQRFIGYEDNDVEKLSAINNKLRHFWGKSSLDDYMNSRWIDLNFLDPNAFVVVDWGDFDNTQERAKPYPFEVYSQDAIMYEYKESVLQYLVVENTRYKWAKDSFGKWTTMQYTVYTMYGMMLNIQFIEVIDESIKAEIRNAFRGNNKLFVEDGNYFRSSVDLEEYYEIRVFDNHNLGFVPAECIGVLHDLSTNGRTYVSPLDKGIPILMKMVKANSEFDLSMALHTFPQKIQYMSPCHEIDCNGGRRFDNSLCETCGGTGFEVIKSAQEVITLALPKNKEDMLDLKGMVHYNYPPVELVKFQKEYIDSLTYQVKESIFNTELFSKQQVAETATGRNISLQNVYDALYPIAVGYSNDWEFLVKTVAFITELDKGLIAFYKFSKDFKLKSLTDLYLDLKAVGDARASEFIKSSIEDDIAGVIYSESERDLLKYNVKKSWYPFNGKTPEQIQLIIGGNLLPLETKVFWANFSYIFDMIELEQSKLNIDFYSLTRDNQWVVIEKKIADLTSKIELTSIKDPELDLREPTDE